MIRISPSRLVVIAGVCVGVAVLAWFLTASPSPRYPTSGTSVVVFGDSLARGQGSTEGNDLASLLGARLQREVHNRGVNGDTTEDGLARVESIRADAPRVVVVMLGGNDALRRVPVETTFLNLEHIILQIHAMGAAVVLVAEPGGLWYGSQYEKEYARLADTHRTFYVSNILRGLLGRNEYMSDAIHPNDAGYRIMADRIEREVRKVLSSNP